MGQTLGDLVSGRPPELALAQLVGPNSNSRGDGVWAACAGATCQRNSSINALQGPDDDVRKSDTYRQLWPLAPEWDWPEPGPQLTAASDGPDSGPGVFRDGATRDIGTEAARPDRSASRLGGFGS